MSSLTHKYIPRVIEREENTFLEEYYSGSDVKIYIDGEEQKEVAYIQYTLSEQLKPIYGYNSRTFDDVSVGNRIVTGVLKIPMKNPADQSAKESVISDYIETTQDSINVFNKEQLNAKNDKEWTNNVVKEDSQKRDDTIFEYQVKLKNLGFQVKDTGIMDSATMEALRSFQYLNKISITSNLTTETMGAIDKALENASLEELILAADATLFSGPASASISLGVLKKGEKVFVLSKDFTDFIMIRTVTGIDAFIQKQYLGG